METLQWESINKNEFSIFMRDLSQHTSINLKHKIEDLNTETKIITHEKKKKNYKSGTPVTSTLNFVFRLSFFLYKIKKKTKYFLSLEQR